MSRAPRSRASGVDAAVVLPCLVDRTAWLEALTAAEDGWSLIPWDGGPLPEWPVGKHRGVIVTDATTALEHQPPLWAVVGTGAASAGAGASDMFSTGFREGGWIASRLFSHAVAHAGAGVWVSGSDPIELLPGLTVTPPPAPTGGDDAVSRALALFDQGPPAVGRRVEWAAELFNREPLDGAGAMDLTGRPRSMAFGPYISLPPGEWRAEVDFALDDGAAGRRFRIDWGRAGDFVTAEIQPTRPGRWRVTVDHLWTEAAPAESRFILGEGAMDGRLWFERMTVTRIG